MPSLHSVAERIVHAPLRYRGSAVACPICGGEFRKFLPGPSGRPNAVCPRCRTLERHRVLWLYLERETDIFSRPQRVLHFSPERVFQKRLKAIHGAGYLSGDLNPRVAMERVNITSIAKPSKSFDVVLVTHVLEHVPDDFAALREIARVVADRGTAILQHPIDYGRATTYEDATIGTPEAKLAAFGHEDHVRWYGADFGARLTSSGLAFRHLRARDIVSAEEAGQFAIPDPDGSPRGDDIYECSVPT